ncbi:nucleoside hydrolase [Poritiphilus flavus]|uniref:Nucleoside hydrolase n=1 Tax=Poritiphilus flavus TaxID=2697053 RepID=A0A6L9EDE8_9FLAO|nr:nucleoside hydrolase [Poritiphilus flavus]NAS12631.1 nucleoside hydrolase [Poritiphilus flavus]
MHKIIIDTDPGIDDSMAIQFAFASGAFEILGLTTVFGNVSIDITTTNALRLLDLLDRSEVPVSKGAANPLEGVFGGGVPFIHGDDGQGNTNKPPSKNKAISLPAHEFIIEQVMKFPNELVLVALGPLTNLALALRQKPEIQHKVKEVVLMGGNPFCPGNATPAAEANILSDPLAADEVLGAEWPVTMIGLDVTHRTLLRRSDFDEITQNPSPINKHVTSAYLFYLDFFKRANKIEGTYLHDASVFAYLMRPDYYTTENYPVRVATHEGVGRGKTWPSVGDTDQEEREALKPWKGRPKINICVDVEGEKVIELLKSVLLSGSV